MKNCGCSSSSNSVLSWYDLQDAAPKNPFDIIAYAELSGTIGQFEYSVDFLNPGGTWVATPVTVQDGGDCKARESDNQQKVGDAAMWSQQHQVTNAATDLAIPLRKMIFLRGGTAWQMRIPLNLAVGIESLQLSFLDNAGTRGDSQATVPVLRFDPGVNYVPGSYVLTVTLKSFGTLSMGLKTIASGTGDQAMMEMDWIIVP